MASGARLGAAEGSPGAAGRSGVPGLGGAVVIGGGVYAWCDAASFLAHQVLMTSCDLMCGCADLRRRIVGHAGIGS